MDLSAFFLPLSTPYHPQPGYWSKAIARFEQTFPRWEDADIIIIGCPDRHEGTPSHESANQIRGHLYQLASTHEKMKVVDLGNLKPRESAAGFNEMLAYVSKCLLEAGKRTWLMGGRQDIILGQVLGYEDRSGPLSLVQVDASLDLHAMQDPASGYLHALLSEYGEWISHFTNLGYHRYRVPKRDQQWMEEQAYTLVRYGSLNGQIIQAEPHLRMAQLVSFDLSAIRASDAPATYHPAPAGFSGIEACQLARYAGLGYGVTSFALTELAASLDHNGQSAYVAALMLWYFVDGHYSRWDDFPRPDRSNLRQYTVQLHASIPHIRFFKHLHSQRWWMEVPSPRAAEAPVLVPCAQSDYECAKGDDIPARWWTIYNRLGLMK